MMREIGWLCMVYGAVMIFVMFCARDGKSVACSGVRSKVVVDAGVNCCFAAGSGDWEVDVCMGRLHMLFGAVMRIVMFCVDDGACVTCGEVGEPPEVGGGWKLMRCCGNCLTNVLRHQ